MIVISVFPSLHLSLTPNLDFESKQTSGVPTWIWFETLFLLMASKSVSRMRAENLPDAEKHLQPVQSYYRIFGVFTLM